MWNSKRSRNVEIDIQNCSELVVEQWRSPQLLKPGLPPSTFADAPAYQAGSHEVHTAGQIPLIPSTMLLDPTSSFKHAALLSLQHLFRIGRAKHVNWWTTGLAFLPHDPDYETQASKIRTALAVWTTLHTPSTSSIDETDSHASDDNQSDAWDLANRRATHHPTFNDAITRLPLPSIPTPTYDPEIPRIPPVFVAEVAALPRAAPIEWAATGLAAMRVSQHDAAPMAYVPPFGALARGTLTALEAEEDSEEVGSGSRCEARYFSVELTRRAQWGAYVRALAPFAWATAYLGEGFAMRGDGDGVGVREGDGVDVDVGGTRGLAIVPCVRVWGREGREVLGVVMGRLGD